MDSSNFIKVKYSEGGFIDKIKWVDGDKVYSVKAGGGDVKEKDKKAKPTKKPAQTEE